MSIRDAARALVLALLMMSAASAAEPTKKKLLLLAQGPDGHPHATHEYLAGLKILARCLEPVDTIDASLISADGAWAEGPELLKHADGVVLFLAEGAAWVQADPRRLDALAALTARGGGVVALHWGIGTRDAKNIPAFLKLAGGCHGGPDRRYKVVEEDVQIAQPAHEICAGIEPFHVRDEFYYQLEFVEPTGSARAIWQVPIAGQVQTVSWAWQRPDGGRSFGFSGLHFHDNWHQVAYRRLVAQAVLWSLKLPIPPQGLPVEVPAADFELKPAK
jgi:type 1 glutamine amidotransferase